MMPELTLLRSQNFTSLAIAVDVGSVQSASSPVVYAVGVVRDPVVQYTNEESRSPYYRVQYTNVHDLVSRQLGSMATGSHVQ